MTNDPAEVLPLSLQELVARLLALASTALRDPARDFKDRHDDTGRVEGAVLALTSLRDLAPLPIDLQTAHVCSIGDATVHNDLGAPHSDEAIRSNAADLSNALDVLAGLLDGPLVMYDAWQDRFSGTRTVLELIQELDHHRPTTVDDLDQRLLVALDAA